MTMAAGEDDPAVQHRNPSTAVLRWAEELGALATEPARGPV